MNTDRAGASDTGNANKIAKVPRMGAAEKKAADLLLAHWALEDLVDDARHREPGDANGP